MKEPLIIDISGISNGNNYSELDMLLDSLYQTGYLFQDLSAPYAEEAINRFVDNNGTTPSGMLLTDRDTFDGDDGPTIRLCLYDEIENGGTALSRKMNTHPRKISAVRAMHRAIDATRSR